MVDCVTVNLSMIMRIDRLTPSSLCSLSFNPNSMKHASLSRQYIVIAMEMLVTRVYNTYTVGQPRTIYYSN